MHFTELAIQGVRGFSKTARVSFSAGYQILRSPTDRAAPLGRLLGALAFPEGRGEDAVFRVPDAADSRAGFTLQGNNQQLWRLRRELGSAGALYALDAASNQFALYTTESAEMAQALQTQAGFVSRAAYFELFSFDFRQLPSQRPDEKATSHAQTAGSSSIVVSHVIDEAAVLGRIAALKAELQRSKALTELQFRADAIVAELYQCEAKAQERQTLEARCSSLAEALRSAPTPDSLSLPADIVERVRRFPEERKLHEQAMQKLFSDKEQAGVVNVMHAAPWFSDRRLLAALAVGVGCLVAPLFLPAPFRPVALLAIAAFGYAGLALLQYIEVLQSIGRQVAKAEVFDTREKKLRDQFAQVNALVQSAYDKVGAQTRDEFFAAMAQKDTLAQPLIEAQMALADFDADPSVQETFDKVQRLQVEQEEVAAELARYSDGYAREVREIEAELRSLEPQHTPARGAAAPEPVRRAITVDPCPALMHTGTQLFALDLEALWPTLKDRALQYLVALTDRRLGAVDIDVQGKCQALVGNTWVPVLQLEPKDIDAVYLSLKLTLAEKWTLMNKFPIMVDHALFLHIEGPKQHLLLRMIRQLGTQTQVLHVVPAAYPEATNLVL